MLVEPNLTTFPKQFVLNNDRVSVSRSATIPSKNRDIEAYESVGPLAFTGVLRPERPAAAALPIPIPPLPRPPSDVEGDANPTRTSRVEVNESHISMADDADAGFKAANESKEADELESTISALFALPTPEEDSLCRMTATSVDIKLSQYCLLLVICLFVFAPSAMKKLPSPAFP